MPNSILIPLLLISINVILGVIGFFLKSFVTRLERSELDTNGLKIEAATMKQQVNNHEHRIVKIENSL
jgi:hypothetical protein